MSVKKTFAAKHPRIDRTEGINDETK